MEMRSSSLPVALVIAMAASLLAVAPGAGAQALEPIEGQVSANYRLGEGPPPAVRGRAVPGLAVNPADPDQVVAVDVEVLTGECTFHSSTDGGLTWTSGIFTVPDDFPTPSCDATNGITTEGSVEWGSGQNVYAAFSVRRGIFGEPTVAGASALVARSTDGGATFQPAVVAMSGAPEGTPSHTQVYVGVEPRAEGDRVYVSAWRNNNQAAVARSDDGGLSFGEPVVASAPVPPSSNNVREVSKPVVAPDGTVFVSWRTARPLSSPNYIEVARSTDQGSTWTVVPAVEVFGQFISRGTHPKMAVDPASGALYIVYQSLLAPPGEEEAFGARDHWFPADVDVLFIRSTDGGVTWSAPLTINDDAGGPGEGDDEIQQRIPQISVAPGGRIDLAWHDRRHAYKAPPNAHVTTAKERLADTYYASSSDGGVTFSANRRITDRSINLDVGLDLRLGPYWFYGVALASPSDDRVLIGWADSRLGNFETETEDIFLAQVELGDTGEIPLEHLSAPLGDYAGLAVSASRRAYPGGGELVRRRPVTKAVIVNEDDEDAALAGAVLARNNFGPVLPVPASGLPGAVAAEVARLEPVGAYVIGDESALSASVISDLVGAGVPETAIVRLSGATPADMAAAVATAIELPDECEQNTAGAFACDPGSPPGSFDGAVIVNPDTPDGAAASALASALRLPVLFTGTDTVPAATTATLTELEIDTTLVIGGPGVVSDDVLTGLPGATRLGGDDAVATSAAVINESVARGFPTNIVYAADPADSMEATLLGLAVSRTGGLLTLAPDAGSARSQLQALGLGDVVDRLVLPGPLREALASACPEALVPDPDFNDITGNVHEAAVKCLAWYGIARGGPGGIDPNDYGPALGVRRDQMASFIARLIDHVDPALLPAGEADPFPCDLGDDNTHFDNIRRLAGAGVVLGGPGGLAATCYGPEQIVERGQMASFINRAIEQVTGSLLASEEDFFGDDDESVHEANIDGVASQGIVLGTGPGTYDPQGSVRRDQMGSFIARTADYLIETGFARTPG